MGQIKPYPQSNTYGGVFMAPGYNNKFMEYTNGNNIFELLDSGKFSSNKEATQRINCGNGNVNNFRLLTSRKIGRSQPIYITLEIDRILDLTKIYFESGSIGKIGPYTLNEAFPLNKNIIANFFFRWC